MSRVASVHVIHEGHEGSQRNPFRFESGVRLPYCCDTGCDSKDLEMGEGLG